MLFLAASVLSEFPNEVYNYKRMYRSLLFLSLILLLCRCASKHQPSSFAPYLPTQPEEILSSSQLAEIATLESQPVLAPLEKKRLYDLYGIELKNISTASHRATELSEKIQNLKPEMEPFLEELEKLNKYNENSNSEKSEKIYFSDSGLKQKYQQAYQSWNQDQNLKALEQIEAILQSQELQKKASSPEWLRVLNLHFRILFDLKDSVKSREAYLALKNQENCAAETAQAGFLTALLVFAEGKSEEGKALLLDQCDPDNSVSNKIKRSYWLFRMSSEGSADQEKFLRELKSFPLPGYYTYLADIRKGNDSSFPVESVSLAKTFDTSSDVEELIRKAEERIQFGLRKDASKFLLLAKEKLTRDVKENLQGLLYLSRLFQAAGNHLEAMKILNTILMGEEGEDPIPSSEAVAEFVHLFHRPLIEQVQWLGKTWSVDPDFIFSIMRQESAFNPGAVSRAGAKGFMQLMPNLAKFLMEQWRTPLPTSKGYLFRGSENIKLASYHLNQLNQIAPHPALVAAAYNAGINRVSLWWKRAGHYPLDVFVEFIPINETRNYVKLVLRNYLYYKAIKNEGQVSKDLLSLQLPPAPAVNADRETALHP